MLRHITKLGCALVALASPVTAQENSIPMGVNVIELLPGWRTVSGSQMAAVHISLKTGWKTYWRVPGNTGIPPTFNWDGSSNMASAIIHWPAPKVYTKDGITTIGYKGDLVLPIEFQPIVAGQKITVKSLLELGVCSDVCVPVSASIQADLTSRESAYRDIIKTALAALPRPANASGVQSVTCTIEPGEDGVTITASVLFNKTAPMLQQSVIEYPQPNTWVEQARMQTAGKTINATARLISYTDTPLIIDRSKLRLTLIGETGAIDIRDCPAPE
ncbi:MAG: protein-disulfide reductase DsbD family protein [Rhodobacterales bacterium]